MGIMGKCSKCGIPINIGYRSKPIGEESDFDLCYNCAMTAGTLPKDQGTIDLCEIIAGPQPAERQGDGQALHTTTPAQNAEAGTSGMA